MGKIIATTTRVEKAMAVCVCVFDLRFWRTLWRRWLAWLLVWNVLVDHAASFISWPMRLKSAKRTRRHLYSMRSLPSYVFTANSCITPGQTATNPKTPNF